MKEVGKNYFGIWRESVSDELKELKIAIDEVTKAWSSAIKGVAQNLRGQFKIFVTVNSWPTLAKNIIYP